MTSLFRTLPDGHGRGGTTRCLCLSNDNSDPLIELRRISAAQSSGSTAELEIADLASETLEAIARDSAAGAALRDACKAELKSREAGGADDGDGEFEAGRNPLVRNAEARKIRSEADGARRLKEAAGQQAVASLSFSKGDSPLDRALNKRLAAANKNPLLKNAEQRAARARA